jgi:hypothetical protein
MGAKVTLVQDRDKFWILVIREMKVVFCKMRGIS